MQFQIALLRGINVGGHKPIPMARLKKTCEGIGLTSVQTYIQSGNIVFKAARKSGVKLADQISGAIQDEFGFEVPVIVRDLKNLRSVLDKNPFANLRGLDPAKLVVVFLSSVPTAANLKGLSGLPVGPDHLELGSQEVYLYCPGGIGKSKLAATNFEKLLGVRTTARNLNTVEKLVEMGNAIDS